MPHTPLMLEVQITKEYLGLATSLVYLGPLFEETLRADTYARGKGSTVAQVIDGSLFGYAHTGMAGVANIGSDRRLDRVALRSSQLVCLRAPGLESDALLARYRRGLGEDDVLRRPGVCRTGSVDDDGGRARPRLTT